MRNGILAALPARDFEALSEGLELVALGLGRAVYESGTRVDYAYFPTDCVISLLSVARDGSSAEIAIAGNEGLVGIALFTGGGTTSSRAVVQNAGYAYRVPAALIKREFDRGGALHLLLLRYTQALITQVSQTALCNRHHSVEQQLCRWLLMSIDRLPTNRLEMTEELIANMLGIAPGGVSAAVGALQAERLIRYVRGAVTVLDRPGLERRACECYAVVQSELERLVRLPARSAAPRLATFITGHMDEIVAQWEAFARTLLPAAGNMTSLALRDHAAGILEAIAGEIEQDPSTARLPEERDAPPPAGLHGALRYFSGFSLPQLGAEFQALRASVIKLWRGHLSHDHDAALDDLTRFNEAVDHALADSIASYAHERARSKDTFLAILGHDLRTPLGAIAMSGQYLSKAILEGSREISAVACIRRSAAKMQGMIADLLEYTRTGLGRSMPIVLASCDIGEICEAALEEMKSAHPDRVFELVRTGELRGSFDAARLAQAFTNLLSNAVQHGAHSPVALEAHGAADAISVHVKNSGRPIPAEALHVIFNPLVQLQDAAAAERRRRSTGMGLGLFIARTIVMGHGGTLAAQSSAAGGTVFTARLPRKA